MTLVIGRTQERENWRETRRLWAEQFLTLCREKDVSIVDVAERTGVPLEIVEDLSLGRTIHHWGEIRKISRFFNRKIRISFVSLEAEDDN